MQYNGVQFENYLLSTPKRELLINYQLNQLNSTQQEEDRHAKKPLHYLGAVYRTGIGNVPDTKRFGR
jgi:hypothetical protein